jgi:hypothetical protein
VGLTFDYYCPFFTLWILPGKVATAVGPLFWHQQRDPGHHEESLADSHDQGESDIGPSDRSVIFVLMIFLPAQIRLGPISLEGRCRCCWDAMEMDEIFLNRDKGLQHQ